MLREIYGPDEVEALEEVFAKRKRSLAHLDAADKKLFLKGYERYVTCSEANALKDLSGHEGDCYRQFRQHGIVNNVKIGLLMDYLKKKEKIRAEKDFYEDYQLGTNIVKLYLEKDDCNYDIPSTMQVVYTFRNSSNQTFIFNKYFDGNDNKNLINELSRHRKGTWITAKVWIANRTEDGDVMKICEFEFVDDEEK